MTDQRQAIEVEWVRGVINSSADVLAFTTLDGAFPETNRAFLAALTGPYTDKGYIGKDGSRIGVSIRLFLVRGANGKPISIGQDHQTVSEEHRATSGVAHGVTTIGSGPAA